MRQPESRARSERNRYGQIYRFLEYNVGDIGTNCYFLVNTDTKEMIIVDPGGDAPILKSRIAEMDLKPAAILLTPCAL